MPERSIPLDDLTIRSALRSKLLADHAEEGDTALMEELGLCRGRVRVDLALVNGHLNGYEIKSDRDTLTRLETQAEIYMKVFDRLTIVVGSKHLSSIGTRLPEWWGILQAIQGGDGRLVRFRNVRRPKLNPQRDPRSLVELLWRDDAIRLLEEADVRGVRGKPRRVVWDRLCDHFDVEEIAAAVRFQLKVRAANQVHA